MTLRAFIFRMALFAIGLTLFIGVISTVISGGWYWPNFTHAFVYCILCTFFCSLLIKGLYEWIASFPRFIFFLCFVFLAGLGVLLGVATGGLVLTGRFSVDWNILWFSLIFGLISSALISGYFELKYHLGEKIARLQAAELENERLKRLESEARLSSIQAKLNPHFLFNTLNSLAALVYNDPKKAEEGIVRLSELYRKVLSISNQTFIPLAEEKDLISDYLELERLRFENQLSYAFQCSEDLLALRIPGLILEPLVGNVIKHVLDRQVRSVHIDVKAEKQGDDFCLSVSDNGPGFEIEEPAPGYGLTSVQERLRLLFGERGNLDIASSAEGTCVTLRLPLSSSSTSNSGGSTDED